MTRYLDPKVFLDEGYLHELNRQFLHPLGLALEVQVGEDGTVSLGRIWDYRDDPEGMAFADETLDPAKVARVAALADARRASRQAALGFWVQPVPEKS